MNAPRRLALVLAIIAVICVAFTTLTYEHVPREGVIIAQAQVPIPCYIQYGSIFDSIFKDPVEKGVFLFSDGHIFVFTNNSPEAIFYPDLIAIFAKFGLKLEDCILHVHNHLIPSSFSEPDKRFAMYLQGIGFKGQFALYITLTQEVKFLK